MHSPGRHRLRVTIASYGGAVALLIAAGAPAASSGQSATSSPQASAAAARCERVAGGNDCLSKREQLKKLRRENAKQKRPNVIVIETDDQDNSLLGMDSVQRALGAHGVTFSNSYVSNPLCCPSRATFLTGQYAHNHGVIGSDPPSGYNALQHSNTLAVWLRKAKYRTGMVGKYLNGYGIDDGIVESVSDAREIPPGWTQWFALTAGSDQRRYQYKLNENGQQHFYGNGGANYVTNVLSSKANFLIKQWAPHARPFFLWFNPTAPHGQSGTPITSTRDPEPAPRYLGRYGNAQAPRTPSFDEADVSDKPQLVRNEPRLSQEQINDIDRRYRGRMESLLSVDEEVGRIVRLLKKTNDLRKTYIVFTSDNGLQLGAHRLIFKSYIYEESTRVPLVIRGPGFPEGTVRNQLVANIDLAPTIADITNVQPRLSMDGTSLLPLANDPALGASRDLLFESYDYNIFGLRRGAWAYNEYGNGDEELYDLLNDPFELQSQHANPSSAGLKSQLAARLAQLRVCAGPTCR